MPSGETIVIVRDPIANSPYAIDQMFIEQSVTHGRAERFGPTPYGHLLDLTRLLEDAMLPLHARLLAVGASAAVNVPLFIAEVDHK